MRILLGLVTTLALTQAAAAQKTGATAQQNFWPNPATARGQELLRDFARKHPRFRALGAVEEKRGSKVTRGSGSLSVDFAKAAMRFNYYGRSPFDIFFRGPEIVKLRSFPKGRDGPPEHKSFTNAESLLSGQFATLFKSLATGEPLPFVFYAFTWKINFKNDVQELQLEDSSQMLPMSHVTLRFKESDRSLDSLSYVARDGGSSSMKVQTFEDVKDFKASELEF